MAERVAELIKKHFPEETFPAIAMTMVQYGLYLARADKQRFVDTLIKVLPNHTGEIMNVAEQFKQEGAQENARQMAMNMFKEGADFTFVKKVSGLSKTELNHLAKKAKNTEEL